MIRYVKQRDNYSCGPVAIMNVCKWAGQEFAYEEQIRHFQKLCSCDADVGTRHRAFDKALRTTARKLGVKVRRVNHPRLKELEDHLSGGGIIVFNYRKKNRISRHFCLLVAVDRGKYFLTVNDYHRGQARRWTSRQMFKKKNLHFQRTDPHYRAWFISQEN